MKMDEDMVREFEEWMKTDEGRKWMEYISMKIEDESVKVACAAMTFGCMWRRLGWC